MAIKSEHKTTSFVIVDFETGGLNLSRPGTRSKIEQNAISEIAMIALRGDTLEEIGRYESLIQPYGLHYDEKAINITGLTPAILESKGKPLSIVAEEVIDFLKQANLFNSKTSHKPIYIAHNANFELKCWQHLFFESDKQSEFSKVLQGAEDYHGNFIPSYLDTMIIAKWLFAANLRVKSFALESVCELMNIAVNDGHRAMNDVISTTEFVKSAIKLLRSANAGVIDNSDKESNLSFRTNFHFQF